MIDYMKRAIVPMYNKKTQKVDFELIVYGRNAVDLLTVPNDVVHVLAEKYPNHTSSPFVLRDWSGT